MGNEYKVLSIDEMTRLGELNGMERYYRYSVKTKGGVRFTIDLDEKNATPEKAAPILLKKAQELDATLALGG